MTHRDKLDALIKNGSLDHQTQLTIRHVRDNLEKYCVEGTLVTGTTRRHVVRSWCISLTYLLERGLGRSSFLDPLVLGTDWVAEANDLREYSRNLRHGARRLQTVSSEVAGAVSDLASLIRDLQTVLDSGESDPWTPLVVVLESRRASLAAPPGTPGRQDDETNVHLVLKAREVRAILSTGEPVSIPSAARGGEFVEAYVVLDKAGRVYRVIDTTHKGDLEDQKKFCRNVGHELHRVRLELVERVDLSTEQSRHDRLRAKLASGDLDAADRADLMMNGLPPAEAKTCD